MGEERLKKIGRACGGLLVKPHPHPSLLLPIHIMKFWAKIIWTIWSLNDLFAYIVPSYSSSSSSFWLSARQGVKPRWRESFGGSDREKRCNWMWRNIILEKYLWKYLSEIWKYFDKCTCVNISYYKPYRSVERRLLGDRVCIGDVQKGCRQLSHEGSLTLPHRQEYSPSQNISKPPNLHNVESTCTHLQFDDDNCVFFGGNNGTSLDCLSWVNCFAISPIASCKKQILPRDIIARWWWYSVRHQLTAAVRVARVFFSLFWETLFCNGWLWSIEGSLQTCLSFVLQTDHKMHVKVSFLLLQDQRIIKNYFFLCKGKKANLNEKCVGAA